MPKGASAERGNTGGTDEEEAANESGQGSVCGTEMCGGTSLRTDQTGSGISSILATRAEESPMRVGAGVHDT